MAVVPPASEFTGPVNEANVDLLEDVGSRTSGGVPVASVSGGHPWADEFVTTAYDLDLGVAYRQSLLFDQFATKRPTMQTHNGAKVHLSITKDLDDDVAGATLNEDYDVAPSRFSTAGFDITMGEYGRVVSRTNLVRGYSSVPFDPVASEKVSRNAVSTLDRLALAALIGTGGISAAPSTFGTVGQAPAIVADVPTKPSQTLQAIAQQFTEKDVPPFANGLYAAIITPAEETALRRESDAGGWRYQQINQEDTGGMGSIARRYIGDYEGFMFFVNNRVGTAAATLGAGAKSLYLGADALAKIYPDVQGFGPQPQSSVAPVIDKLRRFWSVGWLWTGGYSRYKHEAVVASQLDALV